MKFSKNYLWLIMASMLVSLSCNKSMIRAQQTGDRQGFKVVGYLHTGNFKLIDQIELERLTHLDIAFANPDQNGHLIFRAEDKLAEIVQKGHQAGVEVFLSIAGGGIDSTLAAYWLQALQPQSRPKFIKEIIDFTEQYNLDGIDVDIEWNLIPTITDLYTPFVVELKDALHANGKMISSALNVAGLHPSITQEALMAYDFINVMVYDKTGIWRPDVIGPHAPYEYAEEALQYWTTERKVPKEKLTLGVPFYGHDFEAVRYISYQKIIEKDPANAYRDEVGKIFYNGIPSIVQKTKLALESFGGIMIWEIGNDSFDDLSLLRAIDQTIHAQCPPEQITTFYKDENGDGIGDPNKPIQACTKPKGYAAKK
ncbi:MAG: hypothetical protein KDC53_21130 [Saprospiraceae bacterium]|nr:hypothetical protein [Saprospiraceae bacterium]